MYEFSYIPSMDTSRIEVDMDEQLRGRVQNYADNHGVQMPRAYGELLSLGLEMANENAFTGRGPANHLNIAEREELMGSTLVDIVESANGSKWCFVFEPSGDPDVVTDENKFIGFCVYGSAEITASWFEKPEDA